MYGHAIVNGNSAGYLDPSSGASPPSCERGLALSAGPKVRPVDVIIDVDFDRHPLAMTGSET
jgi:hypothetical protein